MSSTLIDPKKVEETVKTLSESVQALENALKSLLTKPLSETTGRLGHLERAKLQVTLAYTMNTLFFVYLRSQGLDPTKHEVTKELRRIHGYVKKVREASGENKGEEQEKEEMPREGRKVDREAAQRFIKHALTSSEVDDEMQGKERKRKNPETTSSTSKGSSSSDKKKKKKRSKTGKKGGGEETATA